MSKPWAAEAMRQCPRSGHSPPSWGRADVDDEIRRALRATGSASGSDAAQSRRFRRELVVGLSEGLGRRNVTLSQVAERVDPNALSWITSLGREAAALAAKPSAEVAERVQAVMLVGLGPFGPAREVLAELLGPQAAARSAARGRPGARSPLELPRYPPSSCRHTAGQPRRCERRSSINFLRSEWIGPLLDAVATGTVSRSDIPLSRRAILLRNTNESIRSRALAIFAREAPGARGEVVKRYRPALSLAADPAPGAAGRPPSLPELPQRGG